MIDVAAIRDRRAAVAPHLDEAERARHNIHVAPEIGTRVGRPTWVVQSRLDALLIARAVTLDQHAATLAFRYLVERAEPRQGSALGRLGCPRRSGTPGEPSTASLDAAAALREVKDAIGRFG